MRPCTLLLRLLLLLAVAVLVLLLVPVLVPVPVLVLLLRFPFLLLFMPLPLQLLLVPRSDTPPLTQAGDRSRLRHDHGQRLPRAARRIRLPRLRPAAAEITAHRNRNHHEHVMP